MKIRILITAYFIITLSIISCNNLDSASPSDRTTFTYFYGGSANFEAQGAEVLDDGFLIVGDSVGKAGFGILILRTDTNGKTIWSRLINGGTASAVKTLSDGYLIIGDSIKVNLKAATVSDIYIRKSRLIKLDLSGTISYDVSFGDTTSNNQKRVDYKGNALVTINENIITINEKKSQNKNIEAVVSSIKLKNAPNKVDTLWTQTFPIINRDFINSRSAHITTSGQVIWSATALLSTQNSSRAYATLPLIQQGSTFDNSSTFGINDGLYYSAQDIQKSTIGFGVIGTYQTITATNKNIYFFRLDQFGNVISESERFFDGAQTDNNILLSDKNISQTDDEGTALTSTSDIGYLLAGNTASTPTRGNGGKDIFLIRIDAVGNVIWNKIFGGSGDETVSTVRQTKDGGFIVCGTLDIAGLKSIFLMKLNGNGDLKY